MTRIASSQSGNSSVGRAQPCQGWGREFESRFPLHYFLGPQAGLLYDPEARFGSGVRYISARWQSGYAAACKAVDAGSIPTLASNFRPWAEFVSAGGVDTKLPSIFWEAAHLHSTVMRAWRNR